MTCYVALPSRGVLALSGSDTVSFLQGLISQDVTKIGPTQAAYGALLTPQGKYLHDFMLVNAADSIILDCEAARRDDLFARLRRYRLRSAVAIEDRSDELQVFAIFGDRPERVFGLPVLPGAAKDWRGGWIYVDPRIQSLGCRAILPRRDGGVLLRQVGLPEASLSAYDEHRTKLGVPDGSRDIQVDKSTLLEANIDRLNGIDWQKGCYIGQELTARTKHRGLLKRRLLTVRVLGSAVPGTPIKDGEKVVGELRSVASDHALALLRLDAVNDVSKGSFRAGSTVVTVVPNATIP